MRKLKYIIHDLKWLKVLFSPFKPFQVKLYVGKIAVGVPYFYPRKWVKYTDDEAKKKANEDRHDPNRAPKPYNMLYKEYKNTRRAVPLKVGFSYCGLGWKTKWSDTDFRYEHGPVFSFVFFGYQIALQVGHEHVDHYWTSWLYYEYATDKTKSKHERIEQCRKEYSQTWTSNVYGTIDYYEHILKPKYLK